MQRPTRTYQVQMPRSRNGFPTRRMLPGVHKVRARSGNSVKAYWYAWRGGPLILKLMARSDAELDVLIERNLAEAAEAYRKAVKPPAPDDFVSGLIAKYLASAEYQRLAKRTKDDLRRQLDVARDGVGTMPLEALKSDGARKVLLNWRDAYKATPKTADGYLGALALVFAWAKRRGDLSLNPLEKWPRLYRADRADVIWTKADLVKLLKPERRPQTEAEKDFRRAVLLAAFTGLRLGDLVRLTWADVGENAITLATGKSRGKRVATIPITAKTRAILKQIGRKDVGAVLTHSKGKPWTAWGIQTAMQRAKASRGIEGLRFHDLRGTAATHFVRWGLPLADVALIMAWTPERVGNIARRYVTAEAVAAGMLERIGKNRSRRSL